jgi:hypothetical protein
VQYSWLAFNKESHCGELVSEHPFTLHMETIKLLLLLSPSSSLKSHYLVEIFNYFAQWLSYLQINFLQDRVLFIMLMK